MSVTSLGRAGGSIRTHPLPPDGFDPRAASPLELRRYGLPQRPDPAIRPELAARWDKIFSRELTYIVPSFRPIVDLLPGIEPRGPLRPELVTVTNPSWSGVVVHATAAQTFTWVQGQWNVPNVAPPTTGKGSWYSFAWIGIDGAIDVTQIGTVQQVSADSNGNLSRSCYAVYEWWPQTWKAIGNFPVSFGDTVFGLICLLSPTDAHINLLNVTTGIHTAWFDFTPPADILSVENQVEWVLENPGVSGASPQLPSFGEIYFDSAIGGHGLDYLVDGGTDTAINMVQNGETVATTTVESPTLIKIAYTGN
jgi:hypothetical protein